MSWDSFFKKAFNVGEKIDPLGHKLMKAVARQDSKNISGIAGTAAGWFGGDNTWLGSRFNDLKDEADKNQADPTRAIGRAALTAGAIFGGGAALGAMGGGAGAGAGAAGGGAGITGAVGATAPEWGAGLASSAGLGTAGTGSLGAGGLSAAGYGGLGSGITGAAGAGGAGAGITGYMGMAAPSYGSAGSLNAFGTAGTGSLGEGVSSGLPSVTGGANTAGGFDWSKLMKQGGQQLQNMGQQQQKQANAQYAQLGQQLQDYLNSKRKQEELEAANAPQFMKMS